MTKAASMMPPNGCVQDGDERTASSLRLGGAGRPRPAGVRALLRLGVLGGRTMAEDHDAGDGCCNAGTGRGDPVCVHPACTRSLAVIEVATLAAVTVGALRCAR